MYPSWMTSVVAVLLLQSAGGAFAAVLPPSRVVARQAASPPGATQPATAGNSCPAPGQGVNKTASLDGRPIFDDAMVSLAALLSEGKNEVGYATPVNDANGGPNTFALFTARLAPGATPQVVSSSNSIGNLYTAALAQNCNFGFQWFPPTGPGQFVSPPDLGIALGSSLQFGFATSANNDLPCFEGSCQNAGLRADDAAKRIASQGASGSGGAGGQGAAPASS
ncbi:MAG: hypothetical protein M1817_000611 [Caeruleum heppii]|nr:MAG: hypothetical protein M1817_000611 [Caeruleum heppii]